MKMKIHSLLQKTSLKESVLLALFSILSLSFMNTVVAQDVGIPEEDEPGVLYIDKMDSFMRNSQGGRNAIYVRPPSGATFSKGEQFGYKEGDSGLRIKFVKKNEGGPYGNGGWCGFYSLLNSNRKYRDNDGFINLKDYKYMSFYVKAETGLENFKVGVADKMWAEMGDSVKSETITSYAPSGELTNEWQFVVIPLDDIFVDWTQINSFAICFEADAFPDGSCEGSVYIDEWKLHKTSPVQL